MKKLIISDQALELMYSFHVRRMIGKGVMTFTEYKRAFERLTGYAVAGWSIP